MQAILFDAGNTLLHLDYPWLAALAERLAPGKATAESLGGATAAVGRDGWSDGPEDADPEDFLTAYYRAIAVTAGLPAGTTGPFAAAARREHVEHPLGLWRRAAPDAREVLQALSARGLRLGVVSNADGRVEVQLTAAGLAPYFGAIVDSHLAGVEKPDPEIYFIALRRLQVEAREALYVGDLFDVDIRGAAAAGMQAVLYDPWDAYPDLWTPRIHSLRELLRVAAA